MSPHRFILFSVLIVLTICHHTGFVIGMSIDSENKNNLTSEILKENDIEKIVNFTISAVKNESDFTKEDLANIVLTALSKDYEKEDINKEQPYRPSIFGLPDEVPEIDEEFANHIKFTIYKNKILAYKYDDFDRNQNTSIQQYCNASENWTFIIHGWRETTETEWVQTLVRKYEQHRRGCIVVVDFERIAFRPYSKLLQYVDPISQILYETIDTWQSQGLDLNKTVIFGFDYGGRIALKLGDLLGNQAVKAIDVCDIAGPGFDDKPENNNFRNAAQNVQCIHTSNDKGTRHYNNCHQNWRLGFCGFRQPEADMSPLSYYKYKSSHRICPYYYILAFDEKIYPQERAPFECHAQNRTVHLPLYFRMGFMENRRNDIQGEFFVPHPPQFPFKEASNSERESSAISRIVDYYREEIVGYKNSPTTIEQFENSIVTAIRGVEPAIISLLGRFGK